MNNTIKELMERKSVRVYKDQEIPCELKKQILEAAMAAPTAGNQQMYTIIDVQDQTRKERLSVLCDNQPFIATAKMVLIFCADYRKWYDAFVEARCTPRKPGVGDMVLSITDACIAAQNSVVAAESLGIGSCYIGDILENNEDVREFLSLPDYVVPCAMLVFGYPTDQQIARPKPKRCNLEDIVCVDTYHTKNGEELRKMFSKECVNRTYDEWATAFCERKYNSDFSKEMTRSVAEYIKEFN